MFCQNCGTKLVEKANFCHHCGASTVFYQPADTLDTTVRFEYCQIEAVTGKSSFFPRPKVNFKFCAEAIGSGGPYIADETQEFKAEFGRDFGDKSQIEPDVRFWGDIHKKFTAQLVKQGWEPLSDRGNQWWQIKFRRRIVQVK
ncbi:MAG: zinc ribbon domain-containing protein [Caldilinea sp. CFX5]|nr:zinc ribbon domain-containing protein [Caldilinea sp. CFX5]